jgi:co-chaperonin GroES (HSP10)
MTEEVLLKYAGQSSSKRKDKEGNVCETYKVKLQDDKKKYTLVISAGDDSLFDTYPEDCELPIQLNKSSQTHLE